MSHDRFVFLFVAIFVLLLASCRGPTVLPISSVPPPGPRSYAVYYGEKSPAPALSGVDWAIVQDNYPPGKNGRTLYFAYISMGEIDPGTRIAKDVSRSPGGLESVTLGKNLFWNSRIADIRKKSFRQALLMQIKRDTKRGFGGIFLDTLDSPLEYGRTHPRQAAGIRRAMESFIEIVHASYPTLHIVVNRGFGLLPELAPFVSGVLYEDFCSRYDEVGKHYVTVPAGEREKFLRDISRARTHNPGLVVLALDYDDPRRPALSYPCARLARKEKFLHYVSDWTLTRSVPGPPVGWTGE